MENEQDMPFQCEGGCALYFFISVHYDFEASALQLLLFWLFTLNFYRFWDNTFVAFEIVQNEWEMSKIWLLEVNGV
jgi:hypothetical protein